MSHAPTFEDDLPPTLIHTSSSNPTQPPSHHPPYSATSGTIILAKDLESTGSHALAAASALMARTARDRQQQSSAPVPRKQQKITGASNASKVTKTSMRRPIGTKKALEGSHGKEGLGVSSSTGDSQRTVSPDIFRQRLTSNSTLTWLIETAQKLQQINVSAENATSLDDVLFGFECMDQLTGNIIGPTVAASSNASAKKSSKSSIAAKSLQQILQNLQSLFYRHVFDMEGISTTAHKDEIVKMPFFEQLEDLRREEEINQHHKEQEAILERMTLEEGSNLFGGSPDGGNALSRLKKLRRDYAEQDKLVKRLHEKVEEKEKVMRRMYQEFQEELALRDNAYNELEKKHTKTMETLTTITRELNELRDYRQHNEKFERVYMDSKNDYHKKGLTNMFSYNTQAEVILQLHQQMELIENERLDRYCGDISTQLFSASDKHSQHNTNQFVHDVTLLTEEMTQLTDKVDELASTFLTDEEVAKRRHRAAAQDHTKLLKNVDPKRFRSYLEVHTSEDGRQKKFKLLHRQSVTPHHEPFDFEVPKDTKWMRIVFALYSHDREHPNPALNILNSEQFSEAFQSKIAKFVDFNIPETSNLWRGYRLIYGVKGPAASRKVSLIQLREFIHLVYEDHWNRLCNHSSKSVRAAASFWSIFFDVVKNHYILPEVVMKVTFELLAAVEQFSEEHADVLEFRRSIEGRNDTSTGRCMSLAMFIVRRIWLSHAKDYGQRIDRKTVGNLFRVIYYDVPTDRLRQLLKEFFDSDEDYHEENAYPLQHFTKYFITNFRDCTEHWCRVCETYLTKVQNRERLHKDDYIDLIETMDAGADRERLATRFVEACQQSVNPSTRQLHVTLLSLLYAESRWVNYWQAMKSHPEGLATASLKSLDL